MRFSFGKRSLRLFLMECLIAVTLLFILAIKYPVQVKQILITRVVAETKIEEIDSCVQFSIEEFIRNLPPNSKFDGDPVYNVLPSERFTESILHGQGNCANKSFGMAYLLRQIGCNYRIVIIFGSNNLLDTNNHTVLEIRETNANIRLVDILTRNVGVDSILQMKNNDGYTPQRSFVSYGNILANSITWYKRENFREAMIGFQTSKEVNRYFDFIELIHLGLSDKKLERYLSDGIAILLGYYPNLYLIDDGSGIPNTEITLLSWLGCGLLWSARVLTVSLCIYLIHSGFMGSYRLLFPRKVS